VALVSPYRGGDAVDRRLRAAEARRSFSTTSVVVNPGDRRRDPLYNRRSRRCSVALGNYIMNQRVVSARSPEAESSHQADHPGQPDTSSPDVDRSVSLTAERVQTIIESATRVRVHAIIESATRVASEILANARAEADLYLEEAEREADRLTMRHIGLMSDLTEALSNRLQVHGRQSEELIRALEDAMRELAAGVRSNAASGPGVATDRTEPTPTHGRDASAGPEDRAPPAL
jgi:hypothetical protein